MSTRRIPNDVVRVQIEASDPAVSAWVAANAGSGKTFVLAQRVIRLMLAGVEPAKILCLTFTKAAAANMANKVFETLAHWTALDDDALDDAIAQLEGEAPDGRRRARARRLFAQALDTPGGLKVQTIHAFCSRLLHQFPFEANVAARFTVLEERAERDLIARLRLQVLLDGAAAPDSPLGRALAAAIVVAADRTLHEVIDEAIRLRHELTGWIGRAGSVDAAVAELSAILGVRPDETVEELQLSLTQGPNLPASEWRSVAGLLSQGSRTDCEQAQRLLTAASAPSREERHKAYRSVFLTDKYQPRRQLVTRPTETRFPDLARRLCDERERVIELDRRCRAAETRERTAAILTIAEAVVARYQAEKDRAGLLDYDDLIERTLTLMQNVEAAWVHYKLDLGIDHVLIDEAQDTSPEQWEIIKKLTAEFTSGEGARAFRRSVFAVGDEKQSIFSFQGAAPAQFAHTRTHFQSQHRNVELEFLCREFKHSFRSGPNVLGAVDAVFGAPHVHAGVVADQDNFPPHIALPGAAPGEVEIWPAIEADKRDEIDGWDAPFDEVAQSSPQARLADRIAATIRVWMRRGGQPKDVLVLVRQRGPLFETVIRALKNADVPVAGADRLVLTEHIAVMDLMVLADAVLLPHDDLALATVLRSPLFGLDEEELFELAFARSGTLRTALDAKADDARFAGTVAALDALARAARSDTPFDFYARLLGPLGGRRRFLARLGHEVADALDEFLNLALDYESRETPSLQGFVAWLRAARTEIKRDMDIVRDEVRVMTVHGAKGLEAQVVILADTTTRPAGPRDPRLLTLPSRDAPPGAPGCLVWAGRSDTDVTPVAEARKAARCAAEQEYRRLLYVAMTRAADRLIVCAAQGVNKRPAGCWYDLVCDALTPGAIEEPADDGQGNVLRWRQVAAVPTPASAPGARARPIVELPRWLTEHVSDVAPAPRFISPSRAISEDVPPQASAAATSRAKAIARGLLVHRLMQSLPDIGPERRHAAAERYLARNGAALDEGERKTITRRVFAILDDPSFAPLFATGTRAEMPLVGRVAQPGGAPSLVSGQVDRLVVTPTSVLIADYKTNAPPPRTVDQVPRAYLIQLALYRLLLGKIYPGRQVRAALVWTEIPDLMELPDAVLDAALAAIGTD